jgi:hypothetical protein
MIVKVISLFLIGMLVLAMFGRLRWPGKAGKKPPGKGMRARKCPDCGSYMIGKGPCACRGKG